MTERAQALEAATAQFVEAYRFALRSSEGDERPAILAMKAAYKAAEAALAVPPPPPVGSPTTERCDVCGEPAIREFCYAAEPWVPYCGLHCPQYAPVGERQLKSTPVEPAGASESPSEDTLLRNIRMAAAMGLSFGHQATPQPLERMVERKDKRLRQILTLLAERGITGSMLRAESNAPVSPVEPTPEPPQRPKLTSCQRCGNTVVVGSRCNCCDAPTGTPAPCVWRTQPDGYLQVGCKPDRCISDDLTRDYSPTHCLWCGHPLTVER